jgi:hydrogenase expression/formation protein HypD
MKYVDEFRDKTLIDKLAHEIRRAVNRRRDYRIMEVCGTHTMSIFRSGLRQILPENIRLISGPGCPVCVTPNAYLDRAIALSRLPGVIVATFGDMLRVPGSHSSLEKERSSGRAVKIVYSTDDALDIARTYPAKEVVFLGIGFETTAPTVAASIITAKKEKLGNYSVLCGHKTMPEVLEALVKDGEVAIDAFLLPGHVSAITGTAPYEFLAAKYGKRCVVAGFEPLDILEAILMLVNQSKPSAEIEYTRVAGRGGNRLARRIMDTVFAKTDSEWRGIGTVKSSGLIIRKVFGRFDAERKFSITVKAPRRDTACICGQVLKGVKAPPDCRLFGAACNPEHPVGACMVSTEGTCAAYYKYTDRKGNG